MPSTDDVADKSRDLERVTLATDYVRGQMDAALALARHAVESGFKTDADEPLPFERIVGTINTTAAKLGVLKEPLGKNSHSIAVDDWNAFELAYYQLTLLMSPVTAETLRDTEGTSRHQREASGEKPDSIITAVRTRRQRLGDVLLGFSPAQRFARGLWLVAIAFAVFVILAELAIFIWGQEADVTPEIQAFRRLLDLLIPWAYGGLGACAYLLRSAHTFIYRRSFDLRRKPEYFNRILLGSISGGAIILFMKYVVDEEGTAVELSSAALGFIAGYSTDFLFNTIERVVTAIFPKVTVETRPPPSAKTRLADLPGPPVQQPATTDSNSPGPES